MPEITTPVNHQMKHSNTLTIHKGRHMKLLSKVAAGRKVRERMQVPRRVMTSIISK